MNLEVDSTIGFVDAVEEDLSNCLSLISRAMPTTQATMITTTERNIKMMGTALLSKSAVYSDMELLEKLSLVDAIFVVTRNAVFSSLVVFVVLISFRKTSSTKNSYHSYSLIILLVAKSSKMDYSNHLPSCMLLNILGLKRDLLYDNTASLVNVSFVVWAASSLLSCCCVQLQQTDSTSQVHTNQVKRQ